MADHDWVDWVLKLVALLTFLATAAAAWLALYSGRRANAALLRERKSSFELQTLARVAELYALGAQGGPVLVKALIQALKPDALPTVQAWLTETDHMVGAPQRAFAAELEQAVRDRLRERG